MSDSFATPRTVACQAPLAIKFPRQEYWRGLPFSPPGDLPRPGIEPTSPALAGRFFTVEPPGKPSPLSTLPYLLCGYSESSRQEFFVSWLLAALSPLLLQVTVAMMILAHVCMRRPFTCVRLFVMLWTGALQASLSMGFSGQEY